MSELDFTFRDTDHRPLMATDNVWVTSLQPTENTTYK